MTLPRDPKAEIRVCRHSVATICLASMLLLTGCAVGPKYQRPPVEVPPAYKEAGNWKAAQPNEQSLGGNWWEIFQDPQLNALEQQVDISNQNLKAAQARYMQARALLRYFAPITSRRWPPLRPRHAQECPATVRLREQFPMALPPPTSNCPLNCHTKSTPGGECAATWSFIASRRKPVLLTWQLLT